MQRNEPIPFWRGVAWAIVIFGAVTAGVIAKFAPVIAQTFSFPGGC